MSESNKTVVRRIFEECLNTGNFQHAGDLVDTSYTYHEPTVGEVRGHDGFQQLITQYRTAFPDLHMTIKQQIEEGDTVVTWWKAEGTQRGELFGVRPTNKHCSCEGVMISRLAKGKVVEDHEQWDVHGLLRQLGAVPSTVKVAA